MATGSLFSFLLILAAMGIVSVAVIVAVILIVLKSNKKK